VECRRASNDVRLFGVVEFGGMVPPRGGEVPARRDAWSVFDELPQQVSGFLKWSLA
jgi:hypothetical protein